LEKLCLKVRGLRAARDEALNSADHEHGECGVHSPAGKIDEL